MLCTYPPLVISCMPYSKKKSPSLATSSILLEGHWTLTVSRVLIKFELSSTISSQALPIFLLPEPPRASNTGTTWPGKMDASSAELGGGKGKTTFLHFLGGSFHDWEESKVA
ncbi:hypothetical protein M404DRAFT_529465 [Pisolithus tinctorius Marx 270]|uniref:Uncharacterized protein n=1 Tax=Pisolithus tinctorius Marx 270 TaxID=870435 RepID=A0A0C3NVR9_PISTI|nr:hypothetical protein M404DRAFT_529465 [Pisolithus tinctorius Marx 270]